MPRKGIYRHNVVVTGSNDGTKQVSLNAWNDDLNRTGMMGFAPTTSVITISAGLLLATDTWTVAEAQGSPTSDDLTNITTTNTLTEDVILLVGKSGDTITVKHAFGGAGQIFLLSGVDKVLSVNVPIQLVRRGTDWYEFGGGGSGIFPDTSFAIQDNADPTKQMLVSLGGASSTFDTTLTFVHTADRVITFPDATTVLVGLSIANVFGDFDQTFKDNRILIESPDGLTPVTFVNSQQTLARNLTIPILTGNRTFLVTGEANQIGDTEINTHTTTKITTTSKSLLNSSIVYIDQTNTYGDFAQTFKDNQVKINNPADTFTYTIVAGAIGASYDLNLPVLTGNDTIAVLGLAQTFTASKTFGEIIHTGRHQYDKGADVTSGSEITLGTDGNVFDITGTTTINTINPTGWQAGSIVVLQFDGTLTVTHNSGGTNDILLAGGTNYSATAGKTLTLFFNGTDWVEIARNGTGGGSDTPWTVNHDFDTFYFDMQIQSAPASPATDNARHYVKTIDANNDGYFVKIKKAGAFVEVQIA